MKVNQLVNQQFCLFAQLTYIQQNKKERKK